MGGFFLLLNVQPCVRDGLEFHESKLCFIGSSGRMLWLKLGRIAPLMVGSCLARPIIESTKINFIG